MKAESNHHSDKARMFWAFAITSGFALAAFRACATAARKKASASTKPVSTIRLNRADEYSLLMAMLFVF